MIVMLKRNCLIGFIFFFTLFNVHAQWTGPKEKPSSYKEVKYGSITPENRQDEAMKRFRAYGLGQFIHWGIYSIAGNEWEGVSARGGAAAPEWIRSWRGPSAPENWTEIYDNLYKEFDPVDFDASKWAKQAKEMGVRYLIFTTKHHDGFAMWPTKYSDYNITNTPFKRDIVKEVVDAYHAVGIDVYLYFSVLEWNNPNYLYNAPETREEEERFAKFLNYTKNQLFELLDNYPQVKGLWFDGTWDEAWKSAYQFTYNLEKELREKKPGLIIGSRFRNDEYGSRHFDSNGNLLGDYEQGWERKLPADISWLAGNDWEGIMTLPPNGWGFMKDWSGLYVKSTDDILEMLMNSVSMNGNFVVNFGPDGLGNMHPGEQALAKEVGDWMAVNKEAVYGVTDCTYPKTPYGYYTQKENNVYLSVFNRPVNDIIRVKVPKDSKLAPAQATLLDQERELPLKHADIGLDLDKFTYFDIQLPSDFHSKRAFVIKMKLMDSSSKIDRLMDAKM